MSSTARRLDRARVTIAEYDAFMDRQPDDDRRYELIDGDIVMMTNPSNRHEDVVRNIGDKLSPAMTRRGCQTFRGNTHVQRADAPNGDKPRPDLMVRCGQTRADPAKNYMTDPLVVIEVLSPSTEETDHLKKVPFYAALPSSRHVVVVSQDERRIEHWHRLDGEMPWERQLLPRDGETLTLTTVAFEITLDEVYDQVTLGPL
ncbi:MAG: Uma2 family endonuclease [Rhodospirillales bacterium]|nr:Uma2 family endonuclease [Rhodospirillales bacterium]